MNTETKKTKTTINILFLIVLTLSLTSIAQAFEITQEHIALCGDQPNTTTKTIPSFVLEQNYNNITIEVTSDISNLISTPLNLFIANYTANQEINLGNINFQSTCSEQKVGLVNINILQGSSVKETQVAYTIAINPANATTNPPNIIQAKPRGDLDVSAVLLEVTTDQNTICKYDSSRTTFNDMQYTFNGDQKEHTASLYLDEGEQKFNVVCKNTNNVLSLPKKIIFSINSPDAKVTDYNPKTYDLKKWDQIIRINTLNAKQCYYTYDLSITNPEYMQTTMSLSETYHEWYFNTDYTQAKIICENEFGKLSNPTTITVKKQEQNKATILFDKDEITSGIFEVEVILDFDVENPELTYQLISSGTTRVIPLEGDGDQWQGLFNIEESTAKQIGEFALTENDESISIVKGKYFVVDPIKPQKITSIQITQQGTDSFMQWFAPNEDIATYNIYRKINDSNVDEFDLYDRTSSNYYKDDNVEVGNTYNYRVSPVDDHHNEGLLSAVQSITIEEVKEEKEEESKILSSTELEIISDIQDLINENQNKIDLIKSTTKNNILNEKYFSDLQLNENKLNEIQSKIETILTKASTTIKELDELKESLENLENELQKYPVKITEDNSKSLDVKIPANTDEFDEEVIRTLRLEPTTNTNKLVKSMRYDNKETKIVFTNTIKEIEIETEDHKETVYEITSESTLDDAIFFVILPKEINKEDVIQTTDNNPIIETKEGLAIKVSNTNKIKTLIKKPIESAQVLIYKEGTENKITGNVVGLSSNSIKWGLISIFMIIAMGLLINLTVNPGKELLSEEAKEQKKFKTKYILPTTPKNAIKIGKTYLRSVFDIYEYIQKANKKQFEELVTKKKNKIADFIINNFQDNKLSDKIKLVTTKEETIAVIEKHCKKRGLMSWFSRK
ncbi:hypothetical protein JXA48_02935 [Candidatus Woesearchaeota archaeon]|nr:hypothetical protein [Candidatus Woesearchaeota archaeon]